MWLCSYYYSLRFLLSLYSYFFLWKKANTFVSLFFFHNFVFVNRSFFRTNNLFVCSPQVDGYWRMCLVQYQTYSSFISSFFIFSFLPARAPLWLAAIMSSHGNIFHLLYEFDIFWLLLFFFSFLLLLLLFSCLLLHCCLNMFVLLGFDLLVVWLCCRIYFLTWLCREMFINISKETFFNTVYSLLQSFSHIFFFQHWMSFRTMSFFLCHTCLLFYTHFELVSHVVRT